MFLVRDIMYCKPGQARPMVQKLLALAKLGQQIESAGCARHDRRRRRALLDGRLEIEVDSLEKHAEMTRKSSEMKEFQEAMKGYRDLVDHGRREIYQIEKSVSSVSGLRTQDRPQRSPRIDRGRPVRAMRRTLPLPRAADRRQDDDRISHIDSDCTKRVDADPAARPRSDLRPRRSSRARWRSQPDHHQHSSCLGRSCEVNRSTSNRKYREPLVKRLSRA